LSVGVDGLNAAVAEAKGTGAKATAVAADVADERASPACSTKRSRLSVAST